MRHFAFVMLICGMPLSAGAHNHILYECVDSNGNKTLTNVPAEPKGCRVLHVSPMNTVPGIPAAPVPAAAPKPSVKSAPIATPSSFPRVDPQTQRNRDNDRLRILEQELGNEQKLLDQARKELTDQESVRLGTEKNYQRVLDRLEPYQKKVRLHEDNIANLRREISKVR